MLRLGVHDLHQDAVASVCGICCVLLPQKLYRSELRAGGKTRTRVIPFSSTLADEGSELHAAVSYSPLPLLGQETAKVVFLGRCTCVFHNWEEFFFPSWLEKEQTNKQEHFCYISHVKHG